MYIQEIYLNVWCELKNAPWLVKLVRTLAAKKISAIFVKLPSSGCPLIYFTPNV